MNAERLPALITLLERQGYTLLELLLACAALAERERTAASPPPAPAEPAGSEWVPLAEFAARAGISLEAARHYSRDARMAAAFRRVGKKVFASAAEFGRLVADGDALAVKKSASMPAPARGGRRSKK